MKYPRDRAIARVVYIGLALVTVSILAIVWLIYRWIT
jgi:hypothetical protein